MPDSEADAPEAPAPPPPAETTATPIQDTSSEFDLDKYLPIFVLTGVFGAIFAFGPLVVPKGPNRQIIRVCIMMSAFCMYVFWVTAYISQMNPLTGPRLHNTTVAWYQYKFGKTVASPKKHSGNSTDDDVLVSFDFESFDNIEEGDDAEPARAGSDKETQPPKPSLAENNQKRDELKDSDVFDPLH